MRRIKTVSLCDGPGLKGFRERLVEVDTDESDLIVGVSVAVDTDDPGHGHCSCFSSSLLDREGISLSLNSPQIPNKFLELF